jgi:hypothetical protein
MPSNQLWLWKTCCRSNPEQQKDGFEDMLSSILSSSSLLHLQLFYCAQVLYKVNINMTKASILLLYDLGSMRETAIPRAWNRAIPGTCINITRNWYANAGFSITTDLIILVLPIFIIYSLQLPRNQKISLMFVFALGGL